MFLLSNKFNLISRYSILKSLFAFAFFILAFPSRAQNKITYLDRDFKETKTKKAIYRMEESELNDTIYKNTIYQKTGSTAVYIKYHKSSPYYFYKKEYYLNGLPKVEGHLVNEKKTGVWKYYSDWGLVSVSRTFENDIENGKRVRYYRNGNIYVEEDIKNGKKVGKFIAYWKNGAIASIGTIEEFPIGRFIGNYRVYDEEGLVIKAQNFVNGLSIADSSFNKEGLYKIVLWKNGTFIKEQNYKNGILISDSLPFSGFDKVIVYDKEPEYRDGYKALNKFIKAHLKQPDYGLKLKAGCNSLFFATIDTSGLVCELDQIGEDWGYGYDKAAYEVLIKMKGWLPALINGVPVKASTIIRVNF